MNNKLIAFRMASVSCCVDWTGQHKFLDSFVYKKKWRIRSRQSIASIKFWTRVTIQASSQPTESEWKIMLIRRATPLSNICYLPHIFITHLYASRFACTVQNWFRCKTTPNRTGALANCRWQGILSVTLLMTPLLRIETPLLPEDPFTTFFAIFYYFSHHLKHKNCIF